MNNCLEWPLYYLASCFAGATNSILKASSHLELTSCKFQYGQNKCIILGNLIVGQRLLDLKEIGEYHKLQVNHSSEVYNHRKWSFCPTSTYSVRVIGHQIIPDFKEFFRIKRLQVFKRCNQVNNQCEECTSKLTTNSWQ